MGLDWAKKRNTAKAVEDINAKGGVASRARAGKEAREMEGKGSCPLCPVTGTEHKSYISYTGNAKDGVSCALCAVVYVALA